MVKFSATVSNFSPLQGIWNGSGVHTASYLKGTGTFSLVVDWLGCETDFSLPPNKEFKNEWRYISTSLYAFMTCMGTSFALHIVLIILISCSFSKQPSFKRVWSNLIKNGFKKITHKMKIQAIMIDMPCWLPGKFASSAKLLWVPQILHYI